MESIKDEFEFRIYVKKCSHIALKKVKFGISYEHHLLVSKVDANEIEIIEYGHMIDALVVGSWCKIQVKKMKYADFFVPHILNVSLISRSEYPEKEEDKRAAIMRAKSRLGETSYNLACNNCEHFVTWALTGQPTCTQLMDDDKTDYTKTLKRFIADNVPEVISKAYKSVRELLQKGLRMLLGKISDCLQRVTDISCKDTQNTEPKTPHDALIQSKMCGLPEANDSRISPKDDSRICNKNTSGISPKGGNRISHKDGSRMSPKDESGLVPKLELIKPFVAISFKCIQIYIFWKEGEHTWQEILIEILETTLVGLSDLVKLEQLPISPSKILELFFHLIHSKLSFMDFIREIFKMVFPIIVFMYILGPGLNLAVVKFVSPGIGGVFFDQLLQLLKLISGLFKPKVVYSFKG